MSSARIRSRVPSAEFVAVAALEAHRLVFHKLSRRDGSAKCDALFTCDPDDQVLGVVYEIADREKPILDRAEGLGWGYEQKLVDVETRDGKSLRVQMYYATDIHPSVRPFCWYSQHVLNGAREHGLPGYYIKAIEAVPADEDPKKRRHERELAIYAEKTR
ncbi:gamma-glutamylcyclotransferase [Marinobacter sp.]|uniref:gamma-glutamylcyclotransferase n=1 Tax=Marinobacter sp. TaxID=50741 RepID=UPI00384D0D4B